MQPIDNIRWIKTDKLKANDYNPNYVLTKEMELLKHSIKCNGWLQPIIINKNNTIIDGYHRVTLIKQDPELAKITDNKVPCITLDLTDAEQKLLTIRINRAKGTHTAYQMHRVIKELHTDYNIPIHILAKEIGANTEEIELLLMENVFQKQKITPKSLYNQAWKPK